MGFMFNNDKSKEEHYTPVSKLYRTSNITDNVITIAPSDIGVSNIESWKVAMVCYETITTSVGGRIVSYESVLPKWEYRSPNINVKNIDTTKGDYVNVILIHAKYVGSN